MNKVIYRFNYGVHEQFHELCHDAFNREGDLRRVADQFLRDLKIKQSWGGHDMAEVKVYRQTAENGELKHILVNNLSVTVPCERMTNEEYTAEILRVTSELPIELADWVRVQAWDSGHSSGYEEVVNIASEMAHTLLEAFKTYNKRVKSAATA